MLLIACYLCIVGDKDAKKRAAVTLQRTAGIMTSANIGAFETGRRPLNLLDRPARRREIRKSMRRPSPSEGIKKATSNFLTLHLRLGPAFH